MNITPKNRHHFNIVAGLGGAALFLAASITLAESKIPQKAIQTLSDTKEAAIRNLGTALQNSYCRSTNLPSCRY